MRRVIAKTARALSLALVLLSTPAWASGQTRPYTLDDLLDQAAFGNLTLDPAGRWIVFEQSAPYSAQTRFDFGLYGRAASNTLWIADARSDAPPERLLPESEGVGHVIGDWSPSGRRLLVFRLQDEAWRLGVLDVETRAVKWLDVRPDAGGYGRVVQWRSEDELVLLDRKAPGLPFVIAWDAGAIALTRERWARQASGSGPTGTVLGSGRFSADTPVSPDVDVVRLNLRTGVRTLLSTGRYFDLELSPDHRKLAAMRLGAMPPVDQERPLWSTDKPERRHVEIIDLDTGAVARPCGGCALAPFLMSWSPDSRDLLAWRTGSDGPTSGDLVALGAGGGLKTFDRFDLEPDVTATVVASFTAVRALWQGDRPVLRARRSGAARYDWFRLEPDRAINLTGRFDVSPTRIESAQGDALVAVADGSAWRLAPDGAVLRLSPPGDLRPFAPFDILDPPRLRYNGIKSGSSVAALEADGRLSVVGRRWTTPGVEPNALVNAVAAGSGQIIEEIERNGVRSLEQRRPDGAIRTLARINTHLADVDFAEPVAVPHVGPGGEPLTSWLYLPTVPTTGRIPLIVLTYPGRPSRRQGDPAEFMTELNFQQMTAAGYAVLTPSVPRPFYPGEPAVGLADQILAVVDAALAQHPSLDGDRLIYWGQSFGGYSGLAVATQTTRFRSIIVQATVSNLAQKWGEFAPWNRADPRWGTSMRHDAGWAETSQGGMGGPPWSDPDRYVRNSPLFHADRIETPILIMQGDRDMGLGQAESMFTALWRQNKDVRFVTWWGEGHTVESAANLREMYRHIFAWLEETAGAPFTTPPSDPTRPAASSRPGPPS